MSATSRSLRAVATVVVASLAVACGSAGPADAEQDYTNAPQLTLVEDVRFCTDEELPECQLTDSPIVAPAPDGGAVIGLPQGPITGFGPNAELVASYGRRGGGPGEYAFVPGVHVAPDGRVILYDFAQSRRTVFAADGTLLGTEPREPDFGMRDMSFGARGYAVLWEPPAEIGDSVISEVRLYRDTLPFIVVGRMPLVRLNDEMGMTKMPGFFKPLFPLWAVESDSSFLLADGVSLRIMRHFSDGRSETVVEATRIGNRAVTADDIRAERATQEAATARVPVRMDPALLNEREADAASHHRFADRVMVLHDGTILLRENAFGVDSARWTMFEGTGEVIGRFALTPAAQVVGGGRDRLLLQNPNELGVPIIAWHRVENP